MTPQLFLEISSFLKIFTSQSLPTAGYSPNYFFQLDPRKGFYVVSQWDYFDQTLQVENLH